MELTARSSAARMKVMKWSSTTGTRVRLEVKVKVKVATCGVNCQ